MDFEITQLALGVRWEVGSHTRLVLDLFCSALPGLAIGLCLSTKCVDVTRHSLPDIWPPLIKLVDSGPTMTEIVGQIHGSSSLT